MDTPNGNGTDQKGEVEMRPPATQRHSWKNRRLVAVALLLMILVGSSPSVAASTQSGEDELLDIDPTNFDKSTVIDNAYMPMKPGHRLVYEGYQIDENGEQIPHVVVETVTDLTKEINGVRTIVSVEEDYSDEELVELEIAFHAQDNDGNVWHLGQLSEVYEEGVLVGGRVWLVGYTEGAHAGIRMLAEPKVGDTYSQGYAPAPFYWTDRSLVYRMDQQTTVPTGSYENVIVIAEWDEETVEGVFQDKYHAPGVGVVRIGFRGPDPEKEEMELVQITELSPAEMADVRREALRIEERAYLYGLTPPAEQAAE
jgi:hypothetical protein